jgi:tetratricopeptide (TPR) repeat protein
MNAAFSLFPAGWRNRSGFCLAAAWLAGLALNHCAAAEWALKDFAFRRKIIVETAAPDTRVARVRFTHLGRLRADAGDIRVTDSAGQLLRHEALRSGPGDQVEILFEAALVKPGADFYVYFASPQAAAPKSWTAEAGVVLEVRRRGDGDADTWEGFQKLLANSKEIKGRILRGRIFDGFNPLGPSEDFVSYYRAYFRVPKGGRYEFATNSDDASFLLVDGGLTADFPGWHGAWAARGERHGAAELSEGAHKLEYYHVQGGGDTVTTAGWKRPGDSHFVLMDEQAFVPVAEAKAQALERADGKPSLDFSWTPCDHLIAGKCCMARYAFECNSAAGANLRWDFSDGSAASGKKSKPGLVELHQFFSPGAHQVTLSADGMPPVTQTVWVEPVWTRREEWNEKLWGEYRAEIAARLESGRIAPACTASVLRMALALDDAKLLEAAAKRAWQQGKLFGPADHAEVFYTLGHQLQEVLKRYDEADRAFQEVVAGPGDAKTKEQAKLHRAGLLIHVFGKNQAALDLLKTLDDTALAQPHEPVLRQMFMADAFAGLGEREKALELLAALRPNVNMANRPYALGRRARLLAVGSYIRSKDYDAARKELQNIEWETPTERIGDETGLLRAECYLAQGENDMAEVLLRRLIKVNTSSARLPEMLYALMKACKALKRSAEVEECYAKLKKDHPYAAETALAALLLEK